MEILRQHPGPIDAIFVPIGGGGLIAGHRGLCQGAAARDQGHRRRAGRRRRAWHASLAAGRARDARAGRPVRRRRRRAARSARRRSASAASCVDDVILVDTDDICAAIKDIFEDTRSVLEPAGALARGRAPRPTSSAMARRGAALIAIACGANINFDRLRFVAERAEIGEHREALLAVTIPERPGSFRTLLRDCWARATSPSSTTATPRRRGARLRRRELRGPRGEAAQIVAALRRRRLPRARHDATTRWPSSMCATWSAAARRGAARTSCSTASSSRSGRAR